MVDIASPLVKLWFTCPDGFCGAEATLFTVVEGGTGPVPLVRGGAEEDGRAAGTLLPLGSTFGTCGRVFTGSDTVVMSDLRMFARYPFRPGSG